LDDASTITDASQLVRQATAQSGAKQWNFNQPKAIPLTMRADDQLYYTGVDRQNERFTRQGTLYVVQVTDPVGFDGSAVSSIVAGSLYVDWQCEFQIPQIEPEAQGLLPTFALERELLFDYSQSINSGSAVITLGTFTLERPYLGLFQVEGGARYNTTSETGAYNYTFQVVDPAGESRDVSRSGITFDPLRVYSDEEFEGATETNSHFYYGDEALPGEYTVNLSADVNASQSANATLKVYGFRLSGVGSAAGKKSFYLRSCKSNALSGKEGSVVWTRPERRGHISYYYQYERNWW
jgi:hypothetical protein